MGNVLLVSFLLVQLLCVEFWVLLPKQCWGFSFRNFSVAVRNLEVAGNTPIPKKARTVPGDKYCT